MEEVNWGVGNRKDEKAFATARMGNDDVELIHGEHPHSRQDNSVYARTKDGTIYEFDGHRLCFKIVIEENNYLKTSYLSGDEIRKSCTGKLYCNGVQIFDTCYRNHEACYKNIQQFIDKMEMNWSWYPLETEKQIGKIVGYKEQLFKIERFIIDQGCVILKTIDGGPRKRFLWEDADDFDGEDCVKVEITSDSICWFPKTEKGHD